MTSEQSQEHGDARMGEASSMEEHAPRAESAGSGAVSPGEIRQIISRATAEALREAIGQIVQSVAPAPPNVTTSVVLSEFLAELKKDLRATMGELSTTLGKLNGSIEKQGDTLGKLNGSIEKQRDEAVESQARSVRHLREIQQAIESLAFSSGVNRPVLEERYHHGGILGGRMERRPFLHERR